MEERRDKEDADEKGSITYHSYRILISQVPIWVKKTNLPKGHIGLCIFGGDIKELYPRLLLAMPDIHPAHCRLWDGRELVKGQALEFVSFVEFRYLTSPLYDALWEIAENLKESYGRKNAGTPQENIPQDKS